MFTATPSYLSTISQPRVRLGRRYSEAPGSARWGVGTPLIRMLENRKTGDVFRDALSALEQPVRNEQVSGSSPRRLGFSWLVGVPSYARVRVLPKPGREIELSVFAPVPFGTAHPGQGDARAETGCVGAGAQREGSDGCVALHAGVRPGEADPPLTSAILVVEY